MKPYHSCVRHHLTYFYATDLDRSDSYLNSTVFIRKRIDTKLLKIINEKQLVSAMNATKWKELIDAESNIDGFSPEVRYQCITSEVVFGFSQVWWNELYEKSSSIKWLEIDPIKTEYRGELVSGKETDYSELVEKLLNKNNIPHSIVNKCLKIWGYICKDENSKNV